MMFYSSMACYSRKYGILCEWYTSRYVYVKHWEIMSRNYFPNGLFPEMFGPSDL